MEVKASGEYTLHHANSVDKTTRYYLLQASTAEAPAKPTTNPPGGNWKTTEPSYSSESENMLYFVDLTELSDGRFQYSEVSKSSSYKAASEAAKTATNYIAGNSEGLVVGDQTADKLGKNVLIGNDEIDIRNGTDVLARFKETLIELGLSEEFIIQILNDAIRFASSDNSTAIAHIGYGDCNSQTDAGTYEIRRKPYYTLGERSNTGSSEAQSSNIEEKILSSTIGEYSVALGYLIEASGIFSCAEGFKTVASGFASHAEGYEVVSSGFASHAEGISTASGDCSHAEGGAIASGKESHAEGASEASGELSHSNGDRTIAAGYAQTAIGKYNIEDSEGTYLFIVGNGTGDRARSNAFVVDKDGNIIGFGNVYADGNFVARNNNNGVFLRYADGTAVNAVFMNTSDELTIGYGQYANGKTTRVYGDNVLLHVGAANNAVFRPYWRKGDSFTMTFQGTGFVTNGSKEVRFAISVDRPIIGNPTVTVASVDGFIIRQEAKYLYGSAAGERVKPSSIACSRQSGMIIVMATMANTTNVTNNNAPVGVDASIKVTLS